MNRQEVFDKVSDHLLTQGKRSTNNGSCKYRSDEGYMCAVGCLIKDEFYDPKMEGSVADDEGVLYVLRNSGINVSSNTDRKFLLDLQIIHDNRDPFTWERELNKFAKDWNLDPVDKTKKIQNARREMWAAIKDTPNLDKNVYIETMKELLTN